MSVAMRYFRRIMSLADAWVASRSGLKQLGSVGMESNYLLFLFAGSGANNELIVPSQTGGNRHAPWTIQAGSLSCVPWFADREDR